MQNWEYMSLTVAYATDTYGGGRVKCINGQEIPNWKQQPGEIMGYLNHIGDHG